ncbi:PhzF family phenazine biosynthesis protein [Anoxybacteroides tepidamans]|uniref:PhzF family phenazine biosynthesis protein n=1 Tax=Anoxybacteroides tepidamans TaxID=265948 RepID=UPI000489CD36|nr:PhzF family phenazine biosynthesis protein [Anoxybacillus tepidamans]
MKQIPVYHVDSFTNKPFGGNPAGVVIDEVGLDDQVMQNIARELNLSETAFLFRTDEGATDFRVRYFTPTTEIDFCGHATVASAWILATEYGWADKANKVVFETNNGPVPVEWTKQDKNLEAVTMTLVAPKVRDAKLSINEAARMVGIPVEEVDDRYPIREAFAGNWHLLIPVKSRAAIDAAQPQLDDLDVANRASGISTTHLFTFDAKEGYDLYTRDFAPAVGIAEDPVTGAANGALTGYLYLEGILEPNRSHQLIIGQGDAIGRPGTLFAEIEPSTPAPVIRIGGRAVKTIAGVLHLG